MKNSCIKKKIKVMHVAECAGGVARYLHSLIKYLDHDMFENILVCSQSFDRKDFENIADTVIQIHIKHAVGMSDIKTVLAVRKLIKKYNPHIVYAHSSKAGAIVRMADIGLKSKCIYNPHGWVFNMQDLKKKQSLYKMIEKGLAPLSNKIICISEAERQSALNNKICSDEKIQVIFNGIDIEEYKTASQISSTRVDLGIPDDTYVVGAVGRLTKQKAPDTFVKCAKLIKDKIPNSFFLLVGDGELNNATKELIKKFGLNDCFIITGWVKNPLNYIQCLDVAMLLSRWEGFGLVLPEYMLLGKPIVATRVDAIPNIIENEKNGLLVEVDNYESAAEAVVKICNNPNLADVMIQNGLACVYEKFSAERVAKETGILLIDVLEY